MSRRLAKPSTSSTRCGQFHGIRQDTRLTASREERFKNDNGPLFLRAAARIHSTHDYSGDISSAAVD
jgi:hypothetical protein